MIVTDSAATVANFTLESAKLELWSQQSDFGIHANMDKEKYMDMDEIEQFLEETHSNNKDLVSLMNTYQSTKGMSVSLLWC